MICAGGENKRCEVQGDRVSIRQGGKLGMWEARRGMDSNDGSVRTHVDLHVTGNLNEEAQINRGLSVSPQTRIVDTTVKHWCRDSTESLKTQATHPSKARLATARTV